MKIIEKKLVYVNFISYVYNVRMRDMNLNTNIEENQKRFFRVENRCKKQKHAGVTNSFGVTWCKDCGLLMK